MFTLSAEMSIDRSLTNIANVLLAKKKNAKVVKVALQQNGYLHKSYRMSKVHLESLCYFQPSPISLDVAATSSPSDLCSDCIAIPIHKECKDILNSQWIRKDDNATSIAEEADKDDKMSPKALFSDEVTKLIIGIAEQLCPYSTSVLGNTKKLMTSTPASGSRSDDSGSKSLNLVQTILYQVVMEFINNSNTDSQISSENLSSRLETRILDQSNNIICPPKLEIMGDCRTLVIPFRALNLNSNPKDDHPFFHKLMTNIASEFNLTECQNDDLNNDGSVNFEDSHHPVAEVSDVIRELMINIWKKLAQAHRSKRVVRRGEIDPNSKVRESGHSIIWMDSENHHEESGPGCEGWITVTEQGIKQSFDLTKVM